MKPRRLFSLLTAVLLLLCAACKPTRNPSPAWTPPPGWGYTDLRLFDPPDAANPQHDLTTLYARTLDGEAQLRLELLDHALLPDYDLYLAFDLRPGGATRLPGGAHNGVGMGSFGGHPCRRQPASSGRGSAAGERRGSERRAPS